MFTVPENDPRFHLSLHDTGAKKREAEVVVDGVVAHYTLSSSNLLYNSSQVARRMRILGNLSETFGSEGVKVLKLALESSDTDAI